MGGEGREARQQPFLDGIDAVVNAVAVPGLQVLERRRWQFGAQMAILAADVLAIIRADPSSVRSDTVCATSTALRYASQLLAAISTIIGASSQTYSWVRRLSEAGPWRANGCMAKGPRACSVRQCGSGAGAVDCLSR